MLFFFEAGPVDQKSLQEHISLISHDFSLFHRTIRENLLGARPESDHGDLVRVCKAVFIHTEIAEMSQGYDVVVGERGFDFAHHGSDLGSGPGECDSE